MGDASPTEILAILYLYQTGTSSSSVYAFKIYDEYPGHAHYNSAVMLQAERVSDVHLHDKVPPYSPDMAIFDGIVINRHLPSDPLSASIPSALMLTVRSCKNDRQRPTPPRLWKAKGDFTLDPSAEQQGEKFALGAKIMDWQEWGGANVPFTSRLYGSAMTSLDISGADYLFIAGGVQRRLMQCSPPCTRGAWPSRPSSAPTKYLRVWKVPQGKKPEPIWPSQLPSANGNGGNELLVEPQRNMVLVGLKRGETNALIAASWSSADDPSETTCEEWIIGKGAGWVPSNPPNRPNPPFSTRGYVGVSRRMWSSSSTVDAQIDAYFIGGDNHTNAVAIATKIADTTTPIKWSDGPLLITGRSSLNTQSHFAATTVNLGCPHYDTIIVTGGTKDASITAEYLSYALASHESKYGIWVTLNLKLDASSLSTFTLFAIAKVPASRCHPGCCHDASSCVLPKDLNLCGQMGDKCTAPISEGYCHTCNPEGGCKYCEDGRWLDKTECKECDYLSRGLYWKTACGALTDPSNSGVSGECLVGHKCAGGILGEMVPCPEGTFQDASGQWQCKPCAAGTFQDAPGQSKCTPCSAGTFQGAPGQSKCTPCHEGHYQDASGQPKCKSCPEGHLQDASGQSKCEACLPGHYQGASGQSKCEACLPGHYQGASGQSKCTPCHEGHYQDASGQSKCTPCHEGHYQDAQGQSKCEACLPGHYQGASGQSKCTPCHEGHFQGASGQSKCEACLPGHYQGASGQSKCTPCHEGHYCPDTGATTDGGQCPKGYYCPTTTTRTPCPPGTYNDETGQIARGACVDCVAGTYQSDPGQPTCTLCPAGTFSDVLKATGVSYCKDCLLNYWSGRGQISCTKCAGDEYTESTRSSSEDSCKVCSDKAEYCTTCTMKEDTDKKLKFECNSCVNNACPSTWDTETPLAVLTDARDGRVPWCSYPCACNQVSHSPSHKIGKTPITDSETCDNAHRAGLPWYDAEYNCEYLGDVGATSNKMGCCVFGGVYADVCAVPTLVHGLGISCDVMSGNTGTICLADKKHHVPCRDGSAVGYSSDVPQCS